MPRWNRESLVCGRGYFFINPGQEERDQWPDSEIEGLRGALLKDGAFWVQGSTFHTGSTGFSSDPMGGVSLPATHELQAWTRPVLRKRAQLSLREAAVDAVLRRVGHPCRWCWVGETPPGEGEGIRDWMYRARS